MFAVHWLYIASVPAGRRNRRMLERGWHKQCVCVSADWRVSVQKGWCCTTDGAETSFDVVSSSQYTVLLSVFPSGLFICQGKQLI